MRCTYERERERERERDRERDTYQEQSFNANSINRETDNVFLLNPKQNIDKVMNTMFGSLEGEESREEQKRGE